MKERLACSFTVTPSVDEPCDQTATWLIRYRIGSHFDVDRELFRCNDHLGDTVADLAHRSDHGYLVSVEHPK